MTKNLSESFPYISIGATTGATFSTTVGNIGLIGSFGGISIGATPIIGAGAVVGAATYGAVKAITKSDPTAIGFIGMGSYGGVTLSSTIGGMGLGVGGTAFGVGMGAMATFGGVVGLGLYGFFQAINSSPKNRIVDSFATFERMEGKILDRVSWQETYNQTMVELDFVLTETAAKQKFTDLEIEAELAQLQKNIDCQNQPNFSPPPTENSDLQPQQKLIWKCTRVIKAHTASIHALAISADNQTFATASSDCSVSLWNFKTGKRLYTFFGYSQEVQTVALNPKTPIVVSGDFEGKITTYNIDTKQHCHTFFAPNSPTSHGDSIFAVAISSDGKNVVSGSADRTIRLWQLETGKLKRIFNGHQDKVWAVALSSDGKTMASGSADKTIRLWNINSYQPPRILQQHSGWVTSLVFHPTGKILASGSTDFTVKLWNLETDCLVCTLVGHSEPIFSIAISGNGKMLASGSQDGTVKIWDLPSGELLQTLAGCYPVAFSGDGCLVSGGDGKNMKIWHQVMWDGVDFLSGEWWEILGVTPNADAETVKLAYRRLARQYHPDVNRNKEAISKMQIINQAYQEFLLARQA
ncbi:DnaJ domain-containing protein [Okeania sp. SIO1I7]|uniref:DnaJ domain-containing protein n=1 Tax=Okeania sp. SIO1I7 TaxID=2607772 RepID=UPI0013F96BFB|nr:DnaJ domain-containing protein [Okeania sp. SIO1I7]NET26804.1 DnaJ domain-containing protein [Okeania sp. SIO1I7]